VHGRGLKAVFDTSLWTGLGDETLPARNHIGDLSAKNLVVPHAMTPHSAPAVTCLPKLSDATKMRKLNAKP